MLWSMALILVPFLGAVVLVKAEERQAQSVLSIAVAALALLASLVNFGLVRGGGVLTWGGSLLRLDALTALFSLFCSFVWLAAGIYMHSYLEHEAEAKKFYFNYLLTLGATQGIFLAGNFVVLLIFFELMTFTSTAWVTFYKGPEAEEAGHLYHRLGVAAGVALGLAVLLLLLARAGLRVGVPATPGSGFLFSLAVLCLLTAFGIKGGMFPLHIWLPKAHPVAPTPGSALLSGILIKTGAYGLVRTGQLAGWSMSGLVPWAGVLLVVLGVITMLVGVCLALLQGHAKRLLAYHSVSQMGYIIVGIGSALVLGEHGAFGLSGAVFHSLNHALFKSSLFFGVGVIMLATGEADLYKLGGLWKKFPATAFMMFIAALGITGTPGLNGYISKTLLHHGILDAAASGSSILVWAERLFVLVGVGTTASFVKLIGLTFLGKQKTEVKAGAGETRWTVLGMALLSIVMVLIGFNPQGALDLVINPAVQAGGIGDISVLGHVTFFEWPAVRDMIITLLAGFVFFTVGMKTHLFHLQLPPWLSIEWLAGAALRQVKKAGSQRSNL